MNDSPGGHVPGENDVPETTGCLELWKPAATDLAELFALYSDPRIADGDPLLLHLSIEQTRAMLTRRMDQWRRDGLSSWVLRARSDDADTGAVIGIGGCSLVAGIAWNLAFTLHPQHWGKGYAQEVAAAGLGRARLLRPELPATAVVAERNVRSHRTIERVGLERVWEGRDPHDPDHTARVALYADRHLSDEEIGRLTN